MSENRNEDLELEFLEDDKDESLELVDENEELELIEEDEDDEDYEDEEDDYEEDDDDNIKQPKEVLINRIMASMGIVIACFTIFYGIKIYGVFNNKQTQPVNEEMNETTQVVEEETTEPVSNEKFVSPYNDENISDSIKELLNKQTLNSMDTGLSKLDMRAENVLTKAVDDKKTVYENVRNIYDYMIYNFELASSTYIDEDVVYDTCSAVDYISYFDMELIYRANKVLNDKSGSVEDFASTLTILLRKYGLDSYYVEGSAKIDGMTVKRGYTVVAIEGNYYLFDVAYEKNSITDAENKTLEYTVFCKKQEEVSDIYTSDGISESIKEFKKFETLAQLSFSAKFTTDNGGSASGSAKYIKGNTESGNSTDASGDIAIDLGDKVYISGSSSVSGSNTWKLAVKVYDENMNYVTESVVYNVTLNSTTNQVSYTPSVSGFIKLNYMITDSNGRTCTVSTMIEVKKEKEIETTKPVASSGELAN